MAILKICTDYEYVNGLWVMHGLRWTTPTNWIIIIFEKSKSYIMHISIFDILVICVSQNHSGEWRHSIEL